MVTFPELFTESFPDLAVLDPCSDRNFSSHCRNPSRARGIVQCVPRPNSRNWECFRQRYQHRLATNTGARLQSLAQKTGVRIGHESFPRAQPAFDHVTPQQSARGRNGFVRQNAGKQLRRRHQRISLNVWRHDTVSSRSARIACPAVPPLYWAANHRRFRLRVQVATCCSSFSGSHT